MIIGIFCKWRTMERANGNIRVVDGALSDVRANARCFILAFEDLWFRIGSMLLRWLCHRERQGHALLGCVGISAVAVIEAGILRRCPFAVHWSIRADFGERYPEPAPKHSILIESPGFLTYADGQSTSDPMISLAAKDIDDRVSTKVADFLLGQTPRAGDTYQRLSASVRHNMRNPMFLSVAQVIDENRIKGLTVDGLVGEHGISRCRIERMFHRIAGVSPAQFIKRKRLESVRGLPNRTNISMMDILIATGFGTAADFSKSFVRQYRIRPPQFFKDQNYSDAIAHRM